ncbi:MAG: glycosyltransferase family 2 protein [Lactobacillales bacterium]|jgi:glycosyltransferase involved in cell wall biosynthesis|nr:glycosyltransferase family 2 protein [Lactobacillales bacterium]
MKKISIVVPCYNEEETVEAFYQACERVLPDLNRLNGETYEFEYIFVDDGSKDSTAAKIQVLNEVNPHCHYIIFARNFGKEAGLYAGLKHASGDFVTVMDADLQDPPEMLLEMVTYLESGEFDCVGTRRADRDGEPKIKSFLSDLFYTINNKISKTNIVNGARDFRLMTRQMTDAILDLSEYNRFSKGLFSWVGFRTKYLPYKNVERVAGETKWNFGSLFKYSIEGVVNFSDTPLKLATIAGFLFSFGAAIMIVIYAFRAIFGYVDSKGFTTIVCLILLLGGIQLIAIGVLGEYIGKIFLETKKRPIYIARLKDEGINERGN